jgi:predicted naringenin-chalcone synthase
MTTIAERQLAVFVRWIAQEQEYMLENEFETTDALVMLQEAAAAALAGTELDEAEIEAVALLYYDATAEDLYGDSDGSDALEHELAATLS